MSWQSEAGRSRRARLRGAGSMALLLCALPLAAQQPAAAAAAPEAPAAVASRQPAMSSRQQQQALRSPAFSPPVAQALLERLSQGLESHSLEQAGSVFDRNSFPPAFFQHMRAAFNYFASYAVYYHLESAQPEAEGASVEVDFRLEGSPQEGALAGRRSQARLKLGLARVGVGRGARSKQEWRIVSVDPQDFLFSF